MAIEVCAGPGSADVERKANGKETAKSQANNTRHIVLPVRGMMHVAGVKQENSRKQVTTGHRRRPQEVLLPWWRRLHLYRQPEPQDR